MLSETTINVVKSTAPVLAIHGEALTRHFYERMFKHNPEVAPLFNPANQHAGRQQRALASAITAYAENIDNLDALSANVELIAHKHASLQIKPEHYPIVGENLIEAIKEVLGDGATADIIDAWREAYGFLAGVLTAREAEIYDYNAALPGGWRGLRSFRVAAKTRESTQITSFRLEPVDGKALPQFRPGQYITLQIPMIDGSTTMRNYSLSCRPNDRFFRISVKRERRPTPADPDGFVSSFLHETVIVGDTLELGPPCGEFTIDVDGENLRPIVLLAGGVGVTPLLSMALALAERGLRHDLVFIHACLNKAAQAFKAELAALAEQHDRFRFYSRFNEPAPGDDLLEETESRGFVDASYLSSILNDQDTDYYICGPGEFMASVLDVLRQWDIPDAQIHYEFFGPKEG